jgi:hypothetical protein
LPPYFGLAGDNRPEVLQLPAITVLTILIAVVTALAGRFPRLFISSMPTDHASGRRSQQPMMASEVSSSATNGGTLETTSGICRRNCCHRKDDGCATDDELHFRLQ